MLGLAIVFGVVASTRSNASAEEPTDAEITPVTVLAKMLPTLWQLNRWELVRVDEKPSVVVDDYRGFLIVLRRTWKHYTDPPQQQRLRSNSLRPFEMRHEDWQFVLVPIQPNKPPITLKSRIEWQKSNSPYHTRDICLGEGRGYVWFTRGTIYSQDYVRRQLKLEGGDDRIQLVVDGLTVDDTGSNTSNSCQPMLAQFGDRALPYIEKAIVPYIARDIDQSRDDDLRRVVGSLGFMQSRDDDLGRVVGSLGYVRTERSTVLLKKLAGSEDKGLRLAAYYALIHPPIRESARQTYIEMLRRHRYVRQVCQASVEFGWQEALPVLRDLIERPRNFREFEVATRTRRIFEGNPIPNSLLDAEQTMHGLAWSDPDQQTEERIRAAYDLLVESDDEEAANTAAVALALLLAKGNTLPIRKAGVEILKRRPKESTMKFLTTLSARLDKSGRSQIEGIIKAVVEP